MFNAVLTRFVVPVIIQHNISLFALSNMGENFNSYYDGWCGALTHKVSTYLKNNSQSHRRLIIGRAKEDGEFIYPSNMSKQWWYHAVVEFNGLIHDPWFDGYLTVEDYCKVMFPNQKVVVCEDYESCLNKE